MKDTSYPVVIDNPQSIIKPQTIEKATKNARASASKFAADPQSTPWKNKNCRLRTVSYQRATKQIP